MPASREIELKLEIRPEDLTALTSHALLAKLPCEQRRQRSIYFDTADGRLRDAGVTLRVREAAGRYVQTVKANGAAGVGLFDRGEWEEELREFTPDLAAMEKMPVSSKLHGKSLRAGIEPIFETVVDRSQWHLTDGGDEVEVVLDRGEVVVEAGSSPINEMELELKEGSPARLFDFARELNGSVPLRLGVLTKSERGYRLLDGSPRSSAKAERVTFSAGRSTGDGFQTIALGCIRHFRLNEPLFTGERNGSALHQARVAFRRLRSAMSLFAPMIEDDELSMLREELRWISGPLGAARDIDVFFQKRIAPADPSPELWSQLLGQREEAFDVAIEALEAERFRRLMITLVQWIATGPWLEGSGEPAAWREEPLRDFAASALDRLWRKLKKRGRHLAHLGDGERHRVRIAGKKLRYASEFFASLFDDKKRRARHAAFVAALEHLQEELGSLNDIVMARVLVDEIGARLASNAARNELIGLAHAAPEAEKQKHLAAGEAAYEALVTAGPFWR